MVFPGCSPHGLSGARRPPPTTKELPRVPTSVIRRVQTSSTRQDAAIVVRFPRGRPVLGAVLVGSRPSLALWCILHHGWCAWPGGWTVFRPLKQSGIFMPTPLEEGASTAGVPRHYAHSYERCRTPHCSLAPPIPIWHEVSARDAAPRHFCCAARGTRSICSEGVHLIHYAG